MVVQQKTPENIRQCSNLLDQLSVGGVATRCFLGIFVVVERDFYYPQLNLLSIEVFTLRFKHFFWHGKSLHVNYIYTYIHLFWAVGRLPFKILVPLQFHNPSLAFAKLWDSLSLLCELLRHKGPSQKAEVMGLDMLLIGCTTYQGAGFFFHQQYHPIVSKVPLLFKSNPTFSTTSTWTSHFAISLQGSRAQHPQWTRVKPLVFAC